MLSSSRLLPHLRISPDRKANGRLAAQCGAAALRRALSEKGRANLVVATGASQFEMIEELLQEPDIAWEKVTVFHLDEYVGLPIEHPASFRLYLWKRFHSRLPLPPRSFHYIAGEGDAESELRRLNVLIQDETIDVCFVGIGENAHLAFNDPPADFETEQAYLIVELDEACRRQQLGEGWFKTLDEVPRRAISMSVRQILKAQTLVATVSDQRKAQAVYDSLEGEVTNRVPASILRTHADAYVFLDSAAASLLKIRS